MLTSTAKSFAPAAAMLIPALAAAQSPAREQARPNVIMIYADDLGYGDLECYGAKNVKTPAVNRLAAEGTRFTNAHATAATSTPSRYSLLTGRYAWRDPGTDVANGDAAMILKSEQYTMADMFRSAGYATAALGKWHLGLGSETGKQDWNATLAASPNDLGFDYSYIMAATADRVPCVFIENGQVANWDPEAPIEVSYKQNFPGEPTGKDNPELLYNLKPSHGHNQAIVNGISRIGYMKGGGKALWKDEDIADSIADHAVRYITENASRPFFLYLATNDVHVPRFPHPRHRSKTTMGLRGAAIAQFDATVETVLNLLDSLGIADNTIVMLSSDNGPVVDDGYIDQAEELLNGHSPTGGLRGGKYSCFEGGTRIPFIVRWPGKVPAGKTSEALVSQIDWLASLASLTGARIPRGAAADSRRQLDAILGLTPDGAPYVIEQASNHALSVRTPRWKYIEPSKGKPRIPWGPDIETGYLLQPQLYDQTTEAGRLEQENVAPANPAETERLAAILAAERLKP